MNSVYSFFDFYRLTFKYEYALNSNLSFLASTIVEPILRIIFFGILTRYSYGNNNKEFIIANIFLLSFSMTYFGVGFNLMRERNSGTLQYLELSQLNKIFVIIGKTSYYFLNAIAIFALNLIICNVIFKLNLTLHMILLLLCTCLALSISTCTFGLMLGAFGFIYRDVNFLYNLIDYLVLILCGANFSTQLLPVFAQHTSKILPVTNILEGVRGLLSNNQSVWITSLCKEIILALVFSIISLFTYKILSKLSIKNATLDLY